MWGVRGSDQSSFSFFEGRMLNVCAFFTADSPSGALDEFTVRKYVEDAL